MSRSRFCRAGNTLEESADCISVVEQSAQPVHHIQAELRVLGSLWVIHTHWALISCRPLGRAHGSLPQNDQAALTQPASGAVKPPCDLKAGIFALSEVWQVRSQLDQGRAAWSKDHQGLKVN